MRNRCILLFAICCAVICLGGCGSAEKKAVGTWTFDDSELSDDFGYTIFSGANQITMTSDGNFYSEKANGKGERSSGEYSFADEEICFTTHRVNGHMGTVTYIYSYDISNSTMVLSNEEGSLTCYK